MMLPVTQHHRSSSRFESRNRLSDSLSVDLESPSRLDFRSRYSARRLSAGFGLRLAPAQTHQKSAGHPFDRSRRQFAAPPPARQLLGAGFGQITQRPQQPKGRRDQFDPDLHAPCGGLTVELAGGGAQFTFQKADAVFKAEAFVVKRFGLARRWRFKLL